MVRRPRDLFEPVVAAGKLNPLFQRMAQGAGHAAARALANAIFANLRDVDRSFVREFQTGGFSARVFELALFAYLEEMCQRRLNLDPVAAGENGPPVVRWCC